MKKRYYVLAGFVLGLFVTMSISFYGNSVARSAYQEFKDALRVNTEAVEFKSTSSDSKIVLYWNEAEEIPYKDAITVRVGSGEKKKIRQIVFKKQ